MSKSTNNQKFEALHNWGAFLGIFENQGQLGFFSKIKRTKEDSKIDIKYESNRKKTT